jgi:superfamily II DNA or RNA helicase
MRVARPYQSAVIESAQKEFRSGVKGIGIVLFTGAGKAFVISKISSMVRAKGGRVLCLVNRDNLVEQLFQSLIEEGMFPQMERGADKASPMAELVVGSVQTMQGERLKKWNKGHFKMVITDEAHFSASSTFKNTLNYFGDSFHIFFTATIVRHDKKALWHGVTKIVEPQMTLMDGINEGWLVPLNFKELPVPLIIEEKSAVKKSLTENEEAEIFDKEDYLPRLFAESAKEVAGKKALMFWPGCKASERATELMTANGLECKHVDGYMSKNQIAAILEWFKNCKNGVLNNADLLSYGYDNPSINVVGIMRLQKSIPMLLQRIGRGTRTVRNADGVGIDDCADSIERRAYIQNSPKPECLILDLMLQIEGVKHNFATAGSLITSDPVEQEFIRQQRKAGVNVNLKELDDLIKTKRTLDEEKSLVRLAEDAANAARKKKYPTPYIKHIINSPKFSRGKPASSGALLYLKRKYNFTPVGQLTAQQAYMITEAYKRHHEQMELA